MLALITETEKNNHLNTVPVSLLMQPCIIPFCVSTFTLYLTSRAEGYALSGYSDCLLLHCSVPNMTKHRIVLTLLNKEFCLNSSIIVTIQNIVFPQLSESQTCNVWINVAKIYFDTETRSMSSKWYYLCEFLLLISFFAFFNGLRSNKIWHWYV